MKQTEQIRDKTKPAWKANEQTTNKTETKWKGEHITNNTNKWKNNKWQEYKNKMN